MKYLSHYCILILSIILLNIVSYASEDSIKVGDFSNSSLNAELPQAWQEFRFDNVEKNTNYSLVDDEGGIVVKAQSDSSASGIITGVKIDPEQYPILVWRWKISNNISQSDVTKKSADDYSARVYVTFDYDPDKISFIDKLLYDGGKILLENDNLPYRAIAYIWGNNADKETIRANAYADEVVMVVVNNQEDPLNQWIQHERNIYKDFKRAFGEVPFMISGVAIMTDTDNTKDMAVAYYGDILFKKTVALE